VFVADFVNGWIRRLGIDGNDRVTGVTEFASGVDTVVDFQQDNAGNLVTLDFGDYSPGTGAIRSITHSGNLRPVSRPSADRTFGESPLTVNFSGGKSSDPEGTALTYSWDFGDGSAPVTTADARHSYSEVGSYTARLTVTDATGRSGEATLQIRVGRPPVAEIVSPAQGSLYRIGTPMEVRGAAQDAEDGALPGSRLTWQLLLHHNVHQHIGASGTGSTFTFVPADDHDADSSYEVRLTATDSDGLTDTRTLTVKPRTTEFTLASSPTGAPVTYAATTQPAPSTRRAAVGYRASVTAAERFVVGGRTYVFDSWSVVAASGTTTSCVRAPPSDHESKT